jgi:hypothetical protein
MDEYPSDPSTKTFFLHFDIRYRFKYAVRNSQRIRYAGVYIESVGMSVGFMVRSNKILDTLQIKKILILILSFCAN